MNRFFFIFLFSILLQSALYSEVKEKDLVGVWNDDKMVMDGWGDCYVFFPDRTFAFNFSQMDMTRRVMSYRGTYAVSGNRITLTIQKITIFLDGRFPETRDPMAEYGPKNGKQITVETKSPVVLQYTFTLTDENVGMGDRVRALNMNGFSFYRLSEKPESFK